MIKPEEAAQRWKEYRGQNVYVRTKHLDSTRHRGRAKVLRFSGERAEILPEGHKHPEWVSLRDLTWWRAMMNKFHPSKIKSKYNGKWAIGLIAESPEAIEEKWWGGGLNQFSCSDPGHAFHYNEEGRAKAALTKVKKVHPEARLLTLDDAWDIHQDLLKRREQLQHAKDAAPVVQIEITAPPAPPAPAPVPVVNKLDEVTTAFKKAIDQRDYLLGLLKMANEDYEKAKAEYEAVMATEQQSVAAPKMRLNTEAA